MPCVQLVIFMWQDCKVRRVILLGKINADADELSRLITISKDIKKKRRCGMIANETTLHKRPNDTEINNYRSPYGLQQ